MQSRVFLAADTSQPQLPAEHLQLRVDVVELFGRGRTVLQQVLHATAFGLLFGLGVYERYLEKGEAFLPEYDALLAATGLGDVKDVAARVGIDVTDVNFWRKSLSVVEKMIDEMEKLA